MVLSSSIFGCLYYSLCDDWRVCFYDEGWLEFTRDYAFNLIFEAEGDLGNDGWGKSGGRDVCCVGWENWGKMLATAFMETRQKLLTAPYLISKVVLAVEAEELLPSYHTCCDCKGEVL